MKTERDVDLDWLRIAALGVLIAFHAGMPFVAEWGWHLKNGVTSHLMLEWMYPFSRFRMALLFVVSGFVTAATLRDGPLLGWLTKRGRRLGVPLLFGVLVVVPPQVYLERRAAGQWHDGEFLAFWRHAFSTGAYPAGDLSWHHLWFLAYVLLFTLALAPLLVRWRPALQALVARLRARAPGAAGLLLAVLPVLAVQALLLPWSTGLQNVVDDAAMLWTHGCYFVFGALLHEAPGLRDAICRARQLWLQVAVGGWVCINVLRWNGLAPAHSDPLAYGVFTAAVSWVAWASVLACLGYARAHWRRDHPWRQPLNDAVFPVYVLHQTITVVLAYYIVPLPDGVGLKFAFIWAATLVLSLAFYAAFIRPFPLLCLLFGGPVRRKPVIIQPTARPCTPALD